MGTVTPGAFLPRCRVLSDYVFVIRPRSATPLLLHAAATGGVLTAAQPSDAQLDFLKSASVRFLPNAATSATARRRNRRAASRSTHAPLARVAVAEVKCSVLSAQSSVSKSASDGKNLSTEHCGLSTHPIDAFIRAKLAEKGLTPAPPADKRTLLRRATFDLIGLPPTPEEVDAFLVEQIAGDLHPAQRGHTRRDRLPRTRRAQNGGCA